MSKPCFYIDGQYMTNEQLLEWASKQDIVKIGKILSQFEHPDMPFKKTDQWVGLGMKWAIQYAAKNGFDGVAWTTGEQQAQRYDLSKQVDEISYNKKTKQLIIWDKNGNTLPPQYTEESELENVIGKEVSQKIIDSSEETVVLSGLDLKVGGEGMKAFYDQIIPSWVNKYAKKFGGKTTTTEIDTTPDIVEHGIDLNTGEVGKDKNYQQVHYLPISDSMVRGVAQGQPLFRSASEMLNGSDSQRKFLAIQSEFNRIAELSNGAITAELVRTVDELPEVLRSNGVSESSINKILKSVKKGSIAGFFIDGKAYVISDNSIDEKEAVRTLIHERGLHGGIRILIPNEKLRIKVLNKVFESVGEDAFNKMVLENGGRPDQYKKLSNWQKGEECLGYLSEKIITEKDLTPKERGVWEWLKNYINNLIAKVLLFDVNSIKFTDKELAHIVRASVNANYVTTNATSGRGRTQEETSSQENREVDRDSSVLEGTERGDNVHDNVQYADSRRSRCVQHIKDALRKEELNNLPYNHGTSAEFKQFDFNKVGEGTGEKIHGHGLYFNITTKDKEVGKSYARMGTLYTPKGMAYMNEVGEKLGKLSQSYLNKAFLKNRGNEEKETVLNTLKGWLSTATQEKNREALSSLVDFVENKQFPNDRYLMTGTLKTRNKEFNFLHWDDPLFKDQWDAIISRLKVEQFNENELIEKVAEKTYSYDMDGGYNYNDPTGASVYRSLSEILGGDVVASNFLRRAGIDGTMFFDKAVNDGDSRVNVCLFSDEGVEVDDTVMFRTAGEYVEGASNATKLSKTENIRRAAQDRMYSVRKLISTVQKRGGVVEDFSNVYVMENLAASKADAAMKSFRKKELKKVTKAITAIIKKTNKTYKKTYNEIIDYLIAKHTPERNEHFRNQGKEGERFAGELTDEEAKIIIETFEKEVGENLINELWSAINQATDYTLYRSYLYGFINKDEYNALKERWKFYIPLRGWAVKDEIDSLWDYSEGDSGGSFDGMVKAKGRTSKADDPIAHIVSMAHSMVVSGEKNMIKQSAFRLANANKDMNDLFTVKKIYQVITGKDADGNDIVTDTYEKPEQKLYDEGKVITKTNRNHNRYRSGGEAKQHEVSLWVNGEKVVVIFDDPNMARAINYKLPKKVEAGVSLVQTFPGNMTRMISMLFTAKNPAFIPINLIRDIFFANASHYIKQDGSIMKFNKNLKNAGGAILRDVRGKSDDVKDVNIDVLRRFQKGEKLEAEERKELMNALYKKFKEYGGETGYVHLDNINKIKSNLLDDLAKLNRSKNLSGFAKKILVDKIVNGTSKMLDHQAEISENISRFSTFITSVELGKSYQKAAYDAKSITVNFNRKGEWSGIFNSLFAFFNATVQAGDNFLTLAWNNKRRFSYVAATFYAAGFINALIHGHDDDDDDDAYFNTSDFVRRNNLVLTLGDKKTVSIPLPHGFRAFYALGDMTYMYMNGMLSEPNFIKESLGAIVGDISPVDPVDFINDKNELTWRPLIPTVITPWYDISVNSDFMGRRIYREPYTTREGMYKAQSQRYDKDTNPLYIALTDGLFELGGGNPKTGLLEEWDKKGNKKVVNKMFDFNPSKIEHITTYYTGGAGKFVNDLTKLSINAWNSVDEALDKNDEVGDILRESVTGVNINYIPVVNRLIREPRSYEYTKEYYSIVKDFNSMNNAISTYNESGDNSTGRALKRSKFYRIVERAKDEIDKKNDRLGRGNLTEKQIEEYNNEIISIKKETVEKIRKLKGNDTESGRD